MAAFEQMFAFESSIVPMENGVFRPLDAKSRWQASGAERFGSGRRFQILYELQNGQFVFLEYADCRPFKEKREDTEVAIWRSPGLPVTREATPLQAAEFLINCQSPVPPHLADVYEESRKPKPPAPMRPISFWAGKNLLATHDLEAAHKVDPLAVAEKIVDWGIQLVQQLRAGRGPRSENFRSATPIFSELLFRIYEVDHKHWWGSKSVIPPLTVDITDLQWPMGSDEARESLRRLRSESEGLLAVVQLKPSGVRNNPTMEEWRAGRTALDAADSVLEQEILHLRTELDLLKKPNGPSIEKEIAPVVPPAPDAEPPLFLEIGLDKEKLTITRGDRIPQDLTELLFAIADAIFRGREKGASVEVVDEAVKRVENSTRGRRVAVSQLRKRLEPLDLTISDARQTNKTYIFAEKVSESDDESDL